MHILGQQLGLYFEKKGLGYGSIGRVITQHAWHSGFQHKHFIGVVVYDCNPYIWEVEADGSEVQEHHWFGVQGQSMLCQTLLQNNKKLKQDGKMAQQVKSVPLSLMT